MHDDMVERVAKAIFENDAESGFDFSNPKTFWRAEGSYWPDSVWTEWTRVARAAIEAMQEPTEPEPVAWRWQVYGVWHYAGGFPVSGAEPLYLRSPQETA